MRRKEIFNNINMVPYLDVMLVLLIIFMITAPMGASLGVHVQLPKASAKPLVMQKIPTSLVIQASGVAKIVHNDKTCYLNIEDHALEVCLKKHSVDKSQTLYVQADNKLVWQQVLTNIVRMHKLGWTQWALVSTEEST